MSFTYDLGSALLEVQDISKIRLLIGDTIVDEGPKPTGHNFEDEELLAFLDEEEDDTGKAAALAIETLANMWASVPRTMFGALIDPRANAAHLRQAAQQMRDKYGHTNKASSIAVQIKRYGKE